eukprot:1158947-Pelagomonas_calceolata.AAC.1
MVQLIHESSVNAWPHTQVSADSTYLRAKNNPKTWVLNPLSRDLSHKPASPVPARPEAAPAAATTTQGAQNATAPAAANASPAPAAASGLPASVPAPPPPPGPHGGLASHPPVPPKSRLKPPPAPVSRPVAVHKGEDAEEDEDLFEMDEVGAATWRTKAWTGFGRALNEEIKEDEVVCIGSMSALKCQIRVLFNMRQRLMMELYVVCPLKSCRHGHQAGFGGGCSWASNKP